MAEYVYLIGADDARHAASEFSSAADSMRSNIGDLQDVLTRANSQTQDNLLHFERLVVRLEKLKRNERQGEAL